MPNISLEGDVGNAGAFPRLLSSSVAVKAQGFVFKKIHFGNQNVDKLKNDCQ